MRTGGPSLSKAAARPLALSQCGLCVCDAKEMQNREGGCFFNYLPAADAATLISIHTAAAENRNLFFRRGFVFLFM
jgi:hypothetical protein